MSKFYDLGEGFPTSNPINWTAMAQC